MATIDASAVNALGGPSDQVSSSAERVASVSIPPGGNAMMRSAALGDPSYETVLVARLAAGETGAPMRELYARYARRIYGLGMRLLGDRGAAEELVQDTFVRLWRSAPAFDAERGSVHGYVRTLAERAAVDQLRRRACRPKVADGERIAANGSSEAPDAYSRLVLSLDLRAAITSLAEDQREVIELSYAEGMSAAEIAARLGVPVGTVKSRRHRALRALQATLEERGFR